MDEKLIDEMQALLDELAGMKKALYTVRPGCACNKKALCAAHSVTWNYLSAAENSLALAIGSLSLTG